MTAQVRTKIDTWIDIFFKGYFSFRVKNQSIFFGSWVHKNVYDGGFGHVKSALKKKEHLHAKGHDRMYIAKS